jgi:hypothetical protein
MDADPPLDYMLDQPNGPAPGRDELLGIVARSHRHRNRVAAAGMAATLALGGVGGWLAAASRGGAGTTTLAAGAPTGKGAPAVAPLTSGGGTSGSSQGGFATAAPDFKLTKVFVRTTTDGVALRAYQNPPVPTQTTAPGCSVSFSNLQVEVSTAAIAGEGSGFFDPSTPAPFKGVGATVIGLAEAAPVWVVTTKTSAGVANVKATFSDGKSDQMAPVDGWAALAHVAPAGTVSYAVTGSVQALDAAGKVIATVPFPTLPILPPAPQPVTGGTQNVITVPATAPSPPAAGAAGGGTVSVGPGGAVTATGPVGSATPTTVGLAPGAPPATDAPAPIGTCEVPISPPAVATAPPTTR